VYRDKKEIDDILTDCEHLDNETEDFGSRYVVETTTVELDNRIFLQLCKYDNKMLKYCNLLDALSKCDFDKKILVEVEKID
jgi:hypothetical protein